MPARLRTLAVAALAAAALLLLSACAGSDGDGRPDATGRPDGEATAANDAVGADVAADAAAGDDAVAASTEPCTVLFGTPNEKTGLTAEQCQPRCDCEGKRFVPPDYGEADIAAIEAMVHLEPLSSPAEDPYLAPDLPAIPPDTVCAIVLDGAQPGAYRLETFASPDAATAAGARVTHEGACGLCSPLVNLAVYMRQPDLTDPVRQCALEGIAKGEAHQMACLMALGFDEPCARIWFYNSRYTQQKCGPICFSLIDAPYHEPDGTLNACLQCDEDEAGPVFKAYAGRTRRNTGLPSSMCRPCSDVLPIVHDYRP